MIRIALIGAGNHSSQHHAPALAKYVGEHPQRLELAAVCDLDYDRAAACARRFGFKAVYTDYLKMLAAEQPDACVCVMPIPQIVPLANDLLGRGIPTTIEKPLGDSLAAARQLQAVAAETGTPHQVSVNRRFQEPLRRGMAWAQAQGALRYVRASLLRQQRSDPDFMSGTAIHAIDALRLIGGEISGYERRIQPGSPPWFQVGLTFAGGALGSLEVLPSCGSVVERYELFGDGFRVAIEAEPSPEPGFRCWQNNRLVLAEALSSDTPDFVRSGAYVETVAFIDALRTGRAPRPTIAEILPAVEIAYQLDPAKRS